MHGPRLLLPVALAQGLFVAGRIPRLPAPVGTGGRFGLSPGRPVRVIGVGDSIIAGTGVRRQGDSLTASYARLLHGRLACDVEWRVHGLEGATSAAVLHKLAPAVPDAHVYVVSCGVNDVTRGVSPAKFAANLAGVLDLLRRKAPQSVVLYGGLPPLDSFPALPWPLRSILAARAQELQAAAATLLARHERSFCFRFRSPVPADQFASDGFHPGERACARWARGLLELWPGAWPAGLTTTRQAARGDTGALRPATRAARAPALSPD
jgi:lysophospholipase L1-like esterase